MIFDQLKEIVTSAIGSIDILIGHVRSERASDDQYFVSFFNSMNGHEDAHAVLFNTPGVCTPRVLMQNKKYLQ
jgi:hypothetical protein